MDSSCCPTLRGPSPRSPWCPPPSSSVWALASSTPCDPLLAPASPSSLLQSAPTPFTSSPYPHPVASPFFTGRRAPSAPAPECHSRVPPPPFPGPGLSPTSCSAPALAPSPASLRLHSFSRVPLSATPAAPPSPRSLPGHPLSPILQPPPPIPQPVSVPAACQLFLAAERLIHAAPAECAGSLLRGRRGRGRSWSWGLGAAARTGGRSQVCFHTTGHLFSVGWKLGVSQGQPRGSGCGPPVGRWGVESRGVQETQGSARARRGSNA